MRVHGIEPLIDPSADGDDALADWAGRLGVTPEHLALAVRAWRASHALDDHDG